MKRELRNGNAYTRSHCSWQLKYSQNEVVEVEQVNELVSINEFKKDLSAIHKEQLDKAVKALNEQNMQDKEEIIEKLNKQQEINEQLLAKIQQLQEEKKQSLLDKIKNLFT